MCYFAENDQRHSDIYGTLLLNFSNVFWPWRFKSKIQKPATVLRQTRYCIDLSQKIKDFSRVTVPLERKLRVAADLCLMSRNLCQLSSSCEHTLSFLLQQFQYLHRFFGSTRLALCCELKGPSGRIWSAWEWYLCIGLARTSLACRFSNF